jgi:hypothetical protein
MIVMCADARRASMWHVWGTKPGLKGRAMTQDVDLDALLRSWRTAAAALVEAECRNPYSYAVDDLTDEVNAARLALTQAGVRDIEALAAQRLQLAHSTGSAIGF